MIHSVHCRVLPALVLLAAACLPAAAQTSGDDAFAATLNAIPTGAATIAQLKAKPRKPATPAPPKAPSAPDAVWQKVLEAVRKDGIYKPPVFMIEDSTGDAKGDHSTRVISVVGMLNAEEQFEAIGALLIVQQYTLDPKDGNIRVDGWMFQTDIYGEVAKASHFTGVQSPDGKTLSSAPEPLDPADPKIQTQYDVMLKYWAERKP